MDQPKFPRPNPHNLPLSKLKDFQIIKQLGKGAYGSVGKYRHIETKKIFAIKTINIVQFTNSSLKMIRKQLQVLYKINNEHILNIYDHFEDQNHVYIITEYLEGQNLFKQYFKKQQPTPMEVIAKVAYQTCVGLQQLHNNNIIHRDIKLQNIVIMGDGKCKIVDFGCSNYYGENYNRHTNVGTQPYWCPQLIKGQKQDDKLDVWCLGVVLYELATHVSPFKQPDFNTKVNTLDFKIPEKLQKQVQFVDLLKKRIFVYKKDRASAYQVRNHPFVKKYYAGQLQKNKRRAENCMNPKTITQYKINLIREIEKYKKAIEQLRVQNEQIEKKTIQSKRKIKQILENDERSKTLGKEKLMESF